MFCTFCIVPRTRGREISRPALAIVAEVREPRGARACARSSLLGQTVNAYGRHDLRRGTPRSGHRAASPSCSRRLAARARDRADPLHEPAPELLRRRPRPRARRAARSSARTCTCPSQSGSDARARADAPALHRGRPTGALAERAARRAPGRRAHDRPDRRLPGRDRRRLRGHARARARRRASSTLTRSSTRRAPARAAAELAGRGRAGGRAGAARGAPGSPALAHARRAPAPGRDETEVLVEGASRRGRRRLGPRPVPPRGKLAARRNASGAGRRCVRVRVVEATPHSLIGEADRPRRATDAPLSRATQHRTSRKGEAKPATGR